MPSYKATIAKDKKLGNYECSYSCREVLQGRKRSSFTKLTPELMSKRWLNLTHVSDGYFFSQFQYGEAGLEERKEKMLDDIRWIMEDITKGLLERIFQNTGSKRSAEKFTIRVSEGKLPTWHQNYVNFKPRLKAVLPAEVMNNSFFPSLFLGIVSSVMNRVCATYKPPKVPKKGTSFEKLIAWAGGSSYSDSPLYGKREDKLKAFFETYKTKGYNKIFNEGETLIRKKSPYSYYQVRGFNEWYASTVRRQLKNADG